MNGLNNLLKHSPNLKHLEVENIVLFIKDDDQMILNQTSVERLVLKSNAPSYDHQLIKACGDDLEVLDITFYDRGCAQNLVSRDWFLPKLNQIYIRGSYRRNHIENIVHNHFPPEARVTYFDQDNSDIFDIFNDV